MRTFEYAGENITDREIMVAVASAIIGLGILVLPRTLAEQTNAADGVISIALAGIGVILLTWVMAKFSSMFPGQSLIDYGTVIVGKPIAVVIVFLYGFILFLSLSQMVRVTANVTREYLFDKTPIEVISLMFLLVLVYAVSSSRVGLFRLNALFFPFITVIILIVTGYGLTDFDIGNVQPFLTTDAKSYFQGAGASALSLTGFGIVLFYTSLVKHTKHVPKAATIGAGIPVVLYMLMFVVIIGVFNNSVTANLVYPSVEMAKVTVIPGHIFDRFESVFFVIWTMAIFNSAAIAFDIVILAMQSVFKNVPKIYIILVLTPLIYFTAMVPGTMYVVETFGGVIGYILLAYTVAITLILVITAKIRGVI